ncbi:MAG: hypothetical protein ABIL42_04195, partial [candidate division WOR-3 bacterium]
MKKSLIILVFTLLLVAGGMFWWFFLREGETGNIISKNLERWKLGNFEGYKDFVINYERFEEVLFLNSLLGKTNLNCSIEEKVLYCENFAPIPIEVFPSSIKIEGEVYLRDTSRGLLQKAKTLPDWKSKISQMSYYDALQVCAGQMRNYSQGDSLYLEKFCIEREMQFWNSIKDARVNKKFLDFFQKRNSGGYSCIDKGRFILAENAFSKTVESPKVPLKQYAEKRLKELSLKKDLVQRKLEIALKTDSDPLAEAFYRRGLDYFSKGD